MRWTLLTVVGLTLLAPLAFGASAKKGLNADATQELRDAGVDKYLGQFTPVSSADVGDGWTKHTFDTDGGDGPICIAGTPYSVFTRAGSPDPDDADEASPAKLLIFLQGGGACWQNFYNCNILSEAQEAPFGRVGIWDFDSPDNPFAKYSIVYMPYCDGSVFDGDNDVADPNFPFGPVRFHRGMRNQSAGIDLARELFPHPSRIVVAGTSAGGVGAAGFTPFLVRIAYQNKGKLMVLDDAGPVTENLAATGDVAARAADWKYGQFYPASCTACDDQLAQTTELIKWRLANDSTIREAYYSTDGDFVIRFFFRLLGDPVGFRNLIVSGTGDVNMMYPDRYKRFIVGGDTSHTALQSPLFYSQDANGILLNEWVGDFLIPRPAWIDIVEDPVP